MPARFVLSLLLDCSVVCVCVCVCVCVFVCSNARVYSPQGAHHLDLRNTNKADPVYVVHARDIERAAIKAFIDTADLRQTLHQ